MVPRSFIPAVGLSKAAELLYGFVIKPVLVYLVKKCHFSSLLSWIAGIPGLTIHQIEKDPFVLRWLWQYIGTSNSVRTHCNINLISTVCSSGMFTFICGVCMGQIHLRRYRPVLLHSNEIHVHER